MSGLPAGLMALELSFTERLHVALYTCEPEKPLLFIQPGLDGLVVPVFTRVTALARFFDHYLGGIPNTGDLRVVGRGREGLREPLRNAPTAALYSVDPQPGEFDCADVRELRAWTEARPEARRG